MRNTAALTNRVSATLPNEIDGVLSSTHVPFAEVETDEGLEVNTRRIQRLKANLRSSFQQVSQLNRAKLMRDTRSARVRPCNFRCKI